MNAVIVKQLKICPSIARTQRSFSTSVCRCGKRTRVPFDKRFPVTAKHVNRHKVGGNKRLEDIVAHHVVPQTGVFDRRLGRFRNVPEMIPEFVVPDLKDFELKAYVSYKAPEVTQTKFTARDLFEACYAPEIVKRYKDGEQQVQNNTSVDGKKKKGS